MSRPNGKLTLQQARDATGMSREKVTAMLAGTPESITSQTLYRWETGKGTPRLYVVKRLAAIYGVDVERIAA